MVEIGRLLRAITAAMSTISNAEESMGNEARDAEDREAGSVELERKGDQIGSGTCALCVLYE